MSYSNVPTISQDVKGNWCLRSRSMEPGDDFLIKIIVNHNYAQEEVQFKAYLVDMGDSYRIISDSEMEEMMCAIKYNEEEHNVEPALTELLENTLSPLYCGEYDAEKITKALAEADRLLEIWKQFLKWGVVCPAVTF